MERMFSISSAVSLGFMAGGGLVKKQQTRVRGQRTENFQAALCAVGERACLGLGKILHVEDGQKLHRALVNDALFLPEAGQAENALGHRVVHLRVHRDGDVFFHAQLAEQADILECARDARAVDLRGVEVMWILPFKRIVPWGG